MGKRVAPGVEKAGRQRYRLWWTDPRTHKEHSSVFEGTRAEAMAAREDICSSIRKRTYVSPSKITLGQYVRAYLRAMKLKDDVAPATHARYSSLLLGSLNDRLGSIPLQDLDAVDIDAYYLWALEHEQTKLKDADGHRKTVSPATIIKRHQALKMVLKDAVAKRELAKNPASDCSPPRRRRPEGIAFPIDEARNVLEACQAGDPNFGLAVRIALFTGLRIGEVLGLRIRDFDLDAGQLTVAGKVLEAKGVLERSTYPKSSHSRRTITIDGELAAAVKTHVKEQAQRRLALGRAWAFPDMLLTTYAGGLLRPGAISTAFTRVVRPMESERDLSTRGATFHSLRHTHATELLRRGVPVSVVSRRLGHKDEIVTLLYYSHVLPGDDAKAAEVFSTAIAVA